MKKPKPIWISRCELSCNCNMYHLTRTRPILNENGQADAKRESDFIYSLCAGKFEAVTGYSLGPGECARIRIIVEQV